MLQARLRVLVTTGCLLAALLAGFAFANTAHAEAPRDLGAQQERQKQIQAETDHLVRRLGTVLRVLTYYRLDQASERKTLEEVATTLRGLSRDQMNEVINRLDSAAKTTDPKKSEVERETAYERHREILGSLRGMLARYDAVKNLEQAAQRMEQHAKTQLDQHLHTAEMLELEKEVAKHGPIAAHAQRNLVKKLGRSVATGLKQQADDEEDLGRDVGNLLKQVHELKENLPAAQQEQIAQVEAAVAQKHTLEEMQRASARLRAAGYPEKRLLQWQEGNDIQWKTAGELQELARMLRNPQDKLAALREARTRIEAAMKKQEELREETKVEQEKQEKENGSKTDKKETKSPDQLKLPGLTELPKPKPETTKPKQPLTEKAADEQLKAAQELGDKQVRLEYDTQDTRNALKPHAKELADKLAPAENAMRDAENALRRRDPEKAVEPQDKAKETLKNVKKEIDKMIAEAEKHNQDPLATLKKAGDTVEQLLKEQKEQKDKTEAANNPKQDYQLPLMAKNQQELGKRTEALKDELLPQNTDVKPALDKAASAMEKAAKAMEAKKGDNAVEKQKKAIEALEAAKKEIGEKVAEIEKRHDEIAKLEDASKKLDNLAKEEHKVAEGAKEMEKKQDNAKDLSNKQGELMPQTKEVAKQIADSVPEAAKKANEGAKQMEAAKNNLDKNEAKPAAKEATDAAKNLEQAKAAVDKALEQKKGQETADQVAMQGKKNDAANAAQEIAKALEQTQQAAEKAKDAQKAAGQQPQDPKAEAAQPKQPDLAKLQQEIANKAGEMKLPEANKDANEAAKALDKADLAKAIEQQKNALAKLEQAAKDPAQPKQGEPHAGKPHAAEPQAGEAKAGEPKQADNNPAEAKAGEPKAGDPKAGEAKGNEPKAAEAKAAAPKAGEPKAGQSHAAEAKAGQPKAGQPKAGEPHAGEAKAGEAKAGEPKGADEMQAKAGTPKAAQPEPGAAKAGDKGEMKAEAKDAGETPKTPAQEATTPAELAKAQKDLLEATQALAKSQEATQAAQAALGQAKAQAPQAVQPQLEKASEQLAKANQELQQAKPGQANEAQQKAAEQLDQALKAMNAAMEAMGQHPPHPGEHPTAQAKAGEPHQGEPEKKPGESMEKNETKGIGERIADGKVNNAKSELRDVNGDGSFLQLPPRQREMIRQALSERLPPEYSALIQQYYINIARGRPAGASAPAPMPTQR